MRLLRIYAPVLVLLAWAIAAALLGLDGNTGTVAAATVLGSVVLQLREVRQSRWTAKQ